MKTRNKDYKYILDISIYQEYGMQSGLEPSISFT